MTTADHGQEDLVRKVWDRIEDLRRQRGYSVTGVNGVDRKLGVSRAKYHKWRNQLPKPGDLIKLERVYNRPSGELLELAEVGTRTTPSRIAEGSIIILDVKGLERHEVNLIIEIHQSLLAGHQRSTQ